MLHTPRFHVRCLGSPAPPTDNLGRHRQARSGIASAIVVLVTEYLEEPNPQRGTRGPGHRHN